MSCLEDSDRSVFSSYKSPCGKSTYLEVLHVANLDYTLMLNNLSIR
jgi:hypothetical protein